MCGIVAAVARDGNIVPVLIEGLKKLEYRGYDSAGLAVLGSGGVDRLRSLGRAAVLEAAAAGVGAPIGIAHTRCATHGALSERNAHRMCRGIAVMHNGIIENSNLKEVQARGGALYVFADADSHFPETEQIHVLRLPEHYGKLSPILHVVPLQVLAYHAALAKGDGCR